MSTHSATDPRVTGHYQRLLAAQYTWMLGGDIERTAAGQRDLLAGLLPIDRDGTAVDLGCGSGAQTLALADLGHEQVLAVDPDPTLLAELRAHAVDPPCGPGRPTPSRPSRTWTTAPWRWSCAWATRCCTSPRRTPSTS